MGQKVNPVGFRVGVTHAWGSRWFAPKKMFGAFLVEDQKIRDVCKKRLAEAGISRILVERYANRVRVTLFSARPGVIIGHKGGDVEAIRAELEKMTKKEWEKEIRTTLPATLGARLKAKLKPDFDVTSDQKFAFAFGYSYAGYAVNSSDDVVATPLIKAGERSKTLKADEIAEWIESQPEGIVAYLYFFDASGNASAATWQ